jgi:hypothetical protein
VPEESHLEEMRSAIRGDFARLAERRGDQELMRVGAEAQPAEDEPVEAEPTPVSSEVEPESAGEHDPRSWFARFLAP